VPGFESLPDAGTDQRQIGNSSHRLQPWNLAAQYRELMPQHHDLQLLGSITAREHERLDKTAKRQGGELGQHSDGLPDQGSRVPPSRAADANRQLTAHARLCAPLTQDGVYEPDRRVWSKVKHTRTADCVVAGYRLHKRGEDLIGSLLLGLFTDAGELASVGVIGAFPLARRRELFVELQPLVTTFEGTHRTGARTLRGLSSAEESTAN
jgi:hypothetical protein